MRVGMRVGTYRFVDEVCDRERGRMCDMVVEVCESEGEECMWELFIIVRGCESQWMNARECVRVPLNGFTMCLG